MGTRSTSSETAWWHDMPTSPDDVAFNALIRRCRVQPFWPEPLCSKGQILWLEMESGLAAGVATRIWVAPRESDAPFRGAPVVAFFVPNQVPLPLTPTHVPKPWGQEIWHSGVEARGVSRVGVPVSDHADAEKLSVSLPLVELALGLACAEQRSALVLLKELDPFDVTFYGELYTEVHHQKSEIYVVTALGADCCPGGLGKVKLGLAAPQATGHHSAHEQHEALGKSLKSFEEVRGRVDSQLEQGGYDFRHQMLQGEQGPRVLAASKETLVDSKLLRRESELSQQTSAFFQLHDLALGDVVRVPVLTPHALQPGVRVVEFQTPHYERLILSSNQKVMTQNHWDIDEAQAALGNNTLGALPERAIERSQPGSPCGVDPLVDFEGLHVVRVKLLEERHARFKVSLGVSPGPKEKAHDASSSAGAAAVAFVVAGHPTLEVGDAKATLKPGNAYLLTGSSWTLSASSGESLLLLGSSLPIEHEQEGVL
jgi:hypothetical protein